MTSLRCHLVVSMDCEPAPGPEGAPGQGSRGWTAQARNIECFATALRDHGVPAVLLVTPEAAAALASSLRDLHDAGAELGLHLHTEHLATPPAVPLGRLSAADQRAQLQRGRDRFAAALGRRPTLFRAGRYSARWQTFALLHELGFANSSTTLPRRQDPDSGACWADAPGAPHMIDGIRETPVTSHPRLDYPPGAGYDLRAVMRKAHQLLPGHRSAFGEGPGGHLRRLLKQLRPGMPTLPARPAGADRREPLFLQIENRDLWLLRAIVSAQLAAARRAGTGLCTLVCTTHSYIPYADPRDRFLPRLRALLRLLERWPGVQLQPSTFAALPEALFAPAAQRGGA